MKLTYREMEEMISSRAKLIQTIIFELDELHELASCLGDCIPNLNHIVRSVYVDGKFVEHKHFNFGLYRCDYDNFSHRFDVQLPIELVEEYTGDEIKSWFENYFNNILMDKKSREIRCDVSNLIYLVNKYIHLCDINNLTDVDKTCDAIFEKIKNGDVLM